MTNFTSNTYKMKREILTFSNKISNRLSKPERKFTADITYGLLASKSQSVLQDQDGFQNKLIKLQKY